MVGGGLRYDQDGPGQIRRVFELARHYDVEVDFHLDGGYDVQHLDYPQVCALTEQLGWQGRVAFGHGSQFFCLPVAAQAAIGQRLGEAGVALVVLPATDLFNAGRHLEHSVMRGVTDAHTLMAHGTNCTRATNNVLNAFTPYGDCSLTRIANLYANVVQRYGPTDLGLCFEMITTRAAQALRLDAYGLAVGHAADLVVCGRRPSPPRLSPPVRCRWRGSSAGGRPLRGLRLRCTGRAKQRAGLQAGHLHIWHTTSALSAGWRGTTSERVLTRFDQLAPRDWGEDHKLIAGGQRRLLVLAGGNVHAVQQHQRGEFQG